MGLIKLEISDKYKDFLYCDLFDSKTLIKKSSDSKKITDGTIICVDKNQFLILVVSGVVIDFTMEEGFYSYSSTSEPLMINDEYGKKLYEYNKNQVIPTDGDISVYYISTNKIGGNKFGTTNPISYFDDKLGINVELRFYGVYTVRITNPILFYYNYKNVIKDKLIYDEKINNEFLTDFISLMPKAFEQLSSQKITYELLSEYNKEIAKKLNSLLREKWSTKGINVVDLSIASITPTDESIDKINDAQNNVDKKIIENSKKESVDVSLSNVISEKTDISNIINPIKNELDNNIVNTTEKESIINTNEKESIINTNENILSSYKNNDFSNSNFGINNNISRNDKENGLELNNNSNIYNSFYNNNEKNVENYNAVDTLNIGSKNLNNSYQINNLGRENTTNELYNNYILQNEVEKKLDNINIDSQYDVVNNNFDNNFDNKSDNNLESIEDFVCPNCHAIMDDDYDYCQCCGTKKSSSKKIDDITCPVCFYKNIPSSKFCNNCGSKLQ